MSVRKLSQLIKMAVDKRIAREARALRGKVSGGRFQVGAKSYPFRQAVDCDADENSVVWAQLSTSGQAVIVGA